MKTLILGGVKSGKSRHAENLAIATNQPVTLIATAMAQDAQMEERIARHKADRPMHWTVIEEPYKLASTLETVCQTGHCVVVDCLTLWLTQLLVKDDEAVLQAEMQAMLSGLPSTRGTLIMVSNETSMGIVPMGELSRRYCDEAGLMHQRLASQFDRAILSVAGIPMVLKGSLPECLA